MTDGPRHGTGDDITAGADSHDASRAAVGAGPDLVDDVAAFGARLRAEGLPVDSGRLRTFAEACALTSYADAYWVGRATLVSAQDHVDRYDRAFAAHFGMRVESTADSEPRDPSLEVPQLVVVPATAEGDDDAEAITPASRIEVLRSKRFADCTEEELREIEALVARLRWSLPPRPSRRRRPSRRGRPDPRRTMRRAMQTLGETWELARRDRRRRRRPLVLILDVSGSMADYSRILLAFAHGALAADASWEAFCFGTRLTRLTPALRAGDPDAAIAAAAAEVNDWHGGTRIGESLKALLDGWGHTRALRGSLVVICSDGLEVGEVEQLGEQMQRLARVAREIVWLNPLSGLEGYEPIARGMAAALPAVDVFASGDTLASLERIAEHLTARR